jgi:4-hydroxyacetophenone monooxygenase
VDPKADVERLRGAVAAAEIHPLLCAVADLTGDLSILRPDLAPDQAQLLLPDKGLTAEQQQEARTLAAEALARHGELAHERRELTPEDLGVIYDFLVGADSTPRWTRFLTEELAPADTDPRAPSWHLDQAAPGRALRCAIVGAGVSGLAAAHRLRQTGAEVTIFEKNADVGGTWLENVYPGCRVDVPNQLYSFSFAQSDAWRGRFSTQPELLDYVRRVTEDLGLTGCIRFSTEVTQARFDDEAQAWEVEIRESEGATGPERFDVLISAVGQLNRPSFPDIAGMGTFAGPSFHSAAWDHSVALEGQRVAVIGTGASAAQFVPHVADQASHLDVYQRTPPWMLPTENYREHFPPEYHTLVELVPTYGRWDRVWQFWLMHEGLLPTAKVDPAWGDTSRSVSALNEFVRAMLVEVLRAQVPEDDLFEKMEPHFPPFSKRGLRDDGIWATTLRRDHVDVITDRIAAITESGVRTEDGTDHPADVVIFGTGFQASKFLAPMRVFGRGGVELNEQWDGDARAYLGITVPDFPNLFMLYGPNTNLVVNGSIIVIVECQVRYIVEALGQLVRGGHRSMCCRPSVHDDYNIEIDEGNLQMAWGVADVPSWYRNERGRVTQNWPFALLDYWERTLSPELGDYELA